METPTSVVWTVAGRLETLELRKGQSVSEAVEFSVPRSVYLVMPEKQTVRGLMRSERGYYVSAVAGTPIPVLGDERGRRRDISFYFSF